MRPDFMCGSCSHGKHDTYPCVACSCGHDASDDARIVALRAQIDDLEAQLAAALDAKPSSTELLLAYWQNDHITRHRKEIDRIRTISGDQAATIHRLEDSLVAARDNALEEAAKEADLLNKHSRGDFASGAGAVADAIRDLKSKDAPRTFTLEEVERAFESAKATWHEVRIAGGSGDDAWQHAESDLCAALTGGGE